MKRYHNQITADEMVKLCRRRERGDLSARDEIISRNMALVYHTAARHSGIGVSFDELVGIGTDALVVAAERFGSREVVERPSKAKKEGCGRRVRKRVFCEHYARSRFSVYFMTYFRKGLSDYRAQFDAQFAMPTSAHRATSKVGSVDRAAKEAGVSLSDAELSERSGVSEKMVACYRGVAARNFGRSLDETKADDEGGERENNSLFAEATEATSGESLRALDADVASLLNRYMGMLPKDQQLVLRERFGLNSRGDEATLDETAKKVNGGVTRERVRQIEASALRSLREQMAQYHGRLSKFDLEVLRAS